MLNDIINEVKDYCWIFKKLYFDNRYKLVSVNIDWDNELCTCIYTDNDNRAITKCIPRNEVNYDRTFHGWLCMEIEWFICKCKID